MNTPNATGVKNPKVIMGSNRLDLSLVDPIAMAEESLAMTEGMIKYGRANFLSSKVVATIYIGAILRHLWKWSCGEERDAKTGVHHLGSARAGLGILLSAQYQNTLIDNRPPRRLDFSDWLDRMESRVAHLKELYKSFDPRHFTIQDGLEDDPDDLRPRI